MPSRKVAVIRNARPPRVTRATPGCLVLLVDQSGSMKSPFLGTEVPKSAAVAYAINETLYHLLANCAPEGEVWDYFHIGAIGYGGHGVQYAFGGSLQDVPLAKASQVDAARRVKKVVIEQDGESVTISKPEWFSARAGGTTPMVAALSEAGRIVREWSEDWRASPPAVVLNVSDGESKDGDPRPAAAALRETGTNLGNTLLFNLQLTAKSVQPVKFPAVPEGITDDFSLVLFEMSSELPGYMLATARQHIDPTLADGARGFCCNADMSTIADFFLVGTPIR